MKIVIASLSIRDEPTIFPPYGSLSILKALRNNGFPDSHFYDIDVLRPTEEEMRVYFERQKPDIVGISGVVSTSYKATKDLSRMIKDMFPDCLIVLGGPMAASAEVILKKTNVDICVLGEGEKPMIAIAQLASTTRKALDFKDIRGLALLDDAGDLINTGYSDALKAEEIYDFDWDDLAEASDVHHFFPEVKPDEARFSQFFRDPRAHEPHRRGKTRGNLITSKGCVSRCTYCHRWDKGIRILPLDEVFRRLEVMIEKYNVGFLDIGDENFGADIAWLTEFCERLKAYDILWVVNTRVTRKTREIMHLMKESGLTELSFGLEAGNQFILDIMEKKVDIKENYDAVTWAAEEQIFGAVALVLGMPGESNETIAETIEFCKYAQTLDPRKNPNKLSANFAQALPGTPLYEYARHKGLIGRDIDSEEAYLLQVSDRNAHDESTTLNFTDVPSLTSQTWRPRITIEVNYHFVKTFGLKHYHDILLNDLDYYDTPKSPSGYFANPQRLMETSARTSADPTIDAPEMKVPSLLALVKSGRWGLALITYPVLAYRLRHSMVFLTWLKNVKRYGLRYGGKLAGEWLMFNLRGLFGKRKASITERKSLRKVVQNDLGPLPGDAPAMEALRRGRW